MLLTANILQPLISVFETVLKFFHDDVGLGWGLSIVFLTVAIRAALTPLTVKQFKSMQALQAHQPELKAIQAKYKEDKQRQQEEMMKFYKENNVNPLGSCLPLLLQFPVFISLYYMLRKDLRGNICPQVQPGAHKVAGKWVFDAAHTHACGLHHGAQFLFIGDLTAKATGVVLIVLIVLYVGTQLLSSLMMSSSAMDPTQRKIMMLMPLVFVFLFISFPSGVLLYWITTNLWTIVQQMIVRRIVGPPPTPVGSAAAEGPGGGGTSGGVRSQASRHGPKGGKDSGRGGKSGSVAVEPAAVGPKPSVGALFKRRLEPASEASGGPSPRSASAGPPPRPPRKKKKRSGRRR